MKKGVADFNQRVHLRVVPTNKTMSYQTFEITLTNLKVLNVVATDFQAAMADILEAMPEAEMLTWGVL